MSELTDAITVRDAKEHVFHRFPWSIPALEDLLKANKEVEILIQTTENKTQIIVSDEKPKQNSPRTNTSQDLYRARDTDRRMRGGFRKHY